MVDSRWRDVNTSYRKTRLSRKPKIIASSTTYLQEAKGFTIFPAGYTKYIGNYVGERPIIQLLAFRVNIMVPIDAWLARISHLMGFAMIRLQA
jgi:hypothetical protein